LRALRLLVGRGDSPMTPQVKVCLFGAALWAFGLVAFVAVCL